MMPAVPVTIVGNVTDTPELRYTTNGVPVVNFTVAVNEKSRDRQTGELVDTEPGFYDCTVWQDFAENVNATIDKGTRVIVYGRIKQRKYQDRDGNNRSGWNVQVDSVGPDLRFARAGIQKMQPKDDGAWTAPGGGGDDTPW